MFIRPHLRNSLRIGFINWKLIIQLSYISNRLNCTGCSFLSFSFSRCRFSSSAILSGPSHLSAWRRSVLYSSRLSYPFSTRFFSKRLTADSRDCRRLSYLFSESRFSISEACTIWIPFRISSRSCIRSRLSLCSARTFWISKEKYLPWYSEKKSSVK